jgi:hypothetical protein
VYHNFDVNCQEDQVPVHQYRYRQYNTPKFLMKISSSLQKLRTLLCQTATQHRTQKQIHTKNADSPLLVFKTANDNRT